MDFNENIQFNQSLIDKNNKQNQKNQKNNKQQIIMQKQKIQNTSINSQKGIISFEYDDTIVYESINPFQSPPNQTIDVTPKNALVKKQLSKYLSEYKQFFFDLQNEADQHIKQCLADSASLQQHKIIIINQKGWNNKLISFVKPFIVIVNQEFEGAIIKYQIVISKFKLQLKLLNVKQESPKNLEKIGEGGFGQIYRINYGESIRIIAKRIIFRSRTQIIDDQQLFWETRPNKRQIQDVLCQYAMYKICSFLKIGPKIKSASGFQMICYSDCVQFYMEQCEKIYQVTKKIQPPKILQRVKLCVRILHKFNIVHKDIKPDNILFSHRYDNFVLADYGISHSIYEQLGHLTATYKDGTQNYMSPQMLTIPRNQKKYVDLYYNDLHALKITLKRLSNLKKSLKVKIIKKVQLNEYYISIRMFMLFSNFRIEQVAQKILDFIPLIRDEIIIKRLKQIGQQNLQKLKLINNNMIEVESLSVTYQRCQNQKNIEKLARLFKLKQILDRIPQGVKNSEKLNFLIRVYGFDYVLLEFVQHMKSNDPFQNIKISKLIQKVKNLKKYKHEFEDIEKLEIIGHFKKIEQILQNQMHKYQAIQSECKKYRKKLIRIICELFQIKMTHKSKNFLEKCSRLLDKIKEFDIYGEYRGLTQIYTKIIQYIQHDIDFEITQKQLIKIENLEKQSEITQNYIKIINILLGIKQLDKVIFIITRYINLQFIEKNNSKLAFMHIQIGNCYYYQNNILKAMENYEKSISLLHQYDHQKSYNSCLNNIGNCYFKKHQYTKAIQYYEKDLLLQIQKIGQCHPQTAASLNNIGNCYLYKKNYTKAFEFFQNSLNIKLLTIGQEHQDTAISFINIGSYFTQIHQYEKAKAYLYKGLHIQIQCVGQKTAQTATSFCNLAKLYQYQEQYQKAIAFSLKALQIKRQLYSQINIDNIPCYYRIGNSYLKLKKYGKAVKYYNIVLQIIKLEISQCNNVKYQIDCIIEIISKLSDIYLIQNKYWNLIYLILNSSKFYSDIKGVIQMNQLSYCYLNLFKMNRKSNSFKKALFYKLEQLKTIKYNQISFKYLYLMSGFYFICKKQLQCLIYLQYLTKIVPLDQNKENQSKVKKLRTKVRNMNKQAYLSYKSYFGQKCEIIKDQYKYFEKIAMLKRMVFKSKQLNLHQNNDMNKHFIEKINLYTKQLVRLNVLEFKQDIRKQYTNNYLSIYRYNDFF